MTTASAGPGMFIDAIAGETVLGLDLAAARWMAQVESAVNAPGLTPAGRINAVREVLGRYKTACGPKVERAA